MAEGKGRVSRLLLNIVLIQIGAFLTAFALEGILVPNTILDGGVVGISIIASRLSGLSLGLFVVILNIPFFLLGLRNLGKRFVVSALYAILSLSLWLAFFQSFAPVTKDLFLATIFGGMVLGLGVGLIIRNGGCLDGTEVISILLNKKIPFSVGEIILFFNIFIFAAAGFFFGLSSALYSAVTYMIAYKAIDLVVEGIDESKSVFIVSALTDEISRAIMEKLNGGVTILRGMGGYSKQERNIVYVIVRRIEVAKIKEMVKQIDPYAFITIQNVHEVIATKRKTNR